MISRRALLGASGLLACGRPKGTAFPGYAFVANEDGHSVAVVDLRRFRVRKQISLDAGPTAVLAHPSRPLIYVLMPRSGSICEIDAAALDIKRTARVASSAVGMRMSQDGRSLWVLVQDPHALVRLPLDSLRPAQRIRLVGPPEDFDVDREGRLAAITLSHARVVVLADLAAGVVARSVTAGPAPRLVRFQSDGKQLLIGNCGDGTITIVDVASGKTVVHLPLPLQPANFCFKPDGGELYVTGPGMDAVVIVFPYTTEIGETILAGNMPDAMAVLASPPYLFVANPATSDITVLDTETRKLVSTVHVGKQPRHILFTPDHQYALVLNRESGDLAVIRVAALREGIAAKRYKIAPLFTMIPVGPKPVSAAVVAV